MFDTYWNHELAAPVEAFAKMPDDPAAELERLRRRGLPRLQRNQYRRNGSGLSPLPHLQAGAAAELRRFWADVPFGAGQVDPQVPPGRRRRPSGSPSPQTGILYGRRRSSSSATASASSCKGLPSSCFWGCQSRLVVQRSRWWSCRAKCQCRLAEDGSKCAVGRQSMSIFLVIHCVKYFFRYVHTRSTV